MYKLSCFQSRECSGCVLGFDAVWSCTFINFGGSCCFCLQDYGRLYPADEEIYCYILISIQYHYPEYHSPNGPKHIVVGVRNRESERLSSIPGRWKAFVFSTASKPALESTRSCIQLVPGAISLGEKRPGREAHHSPLSSAEVEKRGSIPPLHHTSSWHSA
jgi:hypothetical protein